jgi:hypothetical protein
MRQAVLLLGATLLLATTARAQSTSTDTQNNSTVNPTFAATFGTAGDFDITNTTTATTPSPSTASTTSNGPELFAAQPTLSGLYAGLPVLTPYALSAPSEPGVKGPVVVGVFQEYRLLVSAEYSFLRMYVSGRPSVQENMNGFDVGANYYFKNWVGFDADFMLEFGTLFTNTSHFAFIGGGPRFRWAGPQNVQIWGHALAGFSHLSPRTAFGNMGSFAYEAGGGIDFGPRNSRLNYRVQADLVGTTFFGTYQFSPRIAAGVVFKF